MDRDTILEIKANVAFWALLILARLETSKWWALADLLAAAVLFLSFWPTRKPGGRSFWSKVWDR